MTLLITRVPKQTGNCYILCCYSIYINFLLFILIYEDYLLRKRPNQSLEDIPSSKRQPLSSSNFKYPNNVIIILAFFTFTFKYINDKLLFFHRPFVTCRGT